MTAPRIGRSDRRAFVLAALVLSVVVAAIVSLRSRPTPPGHERAVSSGASAREPEPRAEAPRAPPPTPEAASTPLAVGDPDPRASHRADRVSHALLLMRFPPTSQPLRPDQRDVLEPNRRWESPLPLALATGQAKGPPKDGDLSFLFTGNAYAVVGNASLVATLEVFRERGGQRERVSVDVTRSEIVVLDESGPHPVASGIPFGDEGRDGDRAARDGILSATVTPGVIPALARHRGLAKLDITFEPREGDRRPAHASLDFRVGGALPGAFTGVAGERLTPEGLAIDVTMRIDEPGTYFVQGLLFDANDAPIGFATARPQLPAGSATVPLVFWGLLFHEAKAKGPFVFRTLTGHRLPDAAERERADLEPFTGSYRTKSYALSSFSDKEWESPSKELKIKALMDLATKNPEKLAPAASAP